MDEDVAFIGKGWGFPPRFGKQGHTNQMVSGAQEVDQGIEILLRTQIGERMMQQDFGCSLEAYAFEEMNATLLNEIKGNIELAMIKYERRIEVLKIAVTADKAAQGILHIAIDYSIPETNSRYNLVFPYYLEESNER